MQQRIQATSKSTPVKAATNTAAVAGCCSGYGECAKENDWNGWLPLHLACANQGAVEVVHALLEAHGDGEAA